MNGLLTEREWRKKAARQYRRRPAWWGAQCVISRQSRLKRDPAFRAFLLLLSLCIAMMLPVMTPHRTSETFVQQMSLPQTAGFSPREVKDIRYGWPEVTTVSRVFAADELMRGRLMLLDEVHPLPRSAPPPNTFSIAAYGRGMVPVISLNIKSGRETIDALISLFDALRNAGAEGLAVWRGSTSAAQQRQEQLQTMRGLMQRMSVTESLAQVQAELDAPASGEMLQEHAVEIRLRAAPEMQLENSPQGRKLLQLAWRHGFVRTDPAKRPFRFRYVGKAHATAMTYLDVNLQEYLQWMHEKGRLTVYRDGKPQYLILCQPLDGTRAALSLPMDAAYEVSMDNLGYAIAACTL